MIERYHHFMKLTGHPQAAATMVLAELLKGERPVPAKYMSIADIAKMYGINAQTLYRHCQTGRVKHARMGRNIMIRPEDLEAYLEGEVSLF